MSIDPLTIVFAFVAIFVCWRLYGVLGTRNGAERPPMPAARPAPGGPIIDVTPAPAPGPDRWKGVAEAGTPLARGLDSIAAGDPAFEPNGFLAGARGAYEMIISGFAAGNLDLLRGLLAPEPFANFSRAIEARRAAGQTMKVTLVSIDRAEIVEAAAREATAFATVKFSAKMTSVTTDAQGAVVDGSPSAVADHVDVWTFSRPFAARDPNWRLAETQSPH